MPQAIVKLGEHQNRILNIVKGKFGLKNKSEAINLIITEYEDSLEPELRPEYVKKAKKIIKEKPVRIGTLKDFRKRYGLK